MNPVKEAYWSGARQALPFIFVIVPFALLFGVVATEAGFSVLEALTFSVVVVAGASQFTAIQLMTENAPTIIVVASALAVNLRMAMYSAALAPHVGKEPLWKRALAAYFLVDQVFALSSIEFEKRQHWGASAKLAFVFGVATPMAPLWYAFTLLGAYLGSAIPPEFALDFAVPITFLAMIGPALRTVAHIGAASVALVLSPMLIWLPHSLNIMVAGIAAMIVGAAIEKRMEGGHIMIDTMIDTRTIWIVIIGMGVGSFFLRFVFIGFVGDRPIPEWLLRHLRYTAVGFLPAIAAPLALMPQATDGQLDPARLSAAVVTLLVGYFTKNLLWAIFGGASTLYGLMFLLG